MNFDPQWLYEFEEYIETSSFGSKKHVEKLLIMCRHVFRLTESLKIDPRTYSENANLFYRYFIDRKISPDYASKLIRLVNMWASFVCKKRGEYYDPIPCAKGHILNRIGDSYTESKLFRGESDPLTPPMLNRAAGQFPSVEHERWLGISVWFGLRPLEVDKLKDRSTWRYEQTPDVPVLWVYQSKLLTLEKSKRWKPIPIIFPEQQIAMDHIKVGIFRRPLNKTLHRIFNNRRLTCYAGRKGFLDLMLDRGQRLEDISMWLGHQSIETTWRKYRNKRRVSFTPLK